jgi:hypothetical protein
MKIIGKIMQPYAIKGTMRIAQIDTEENLVEIDLGYRNDLTMIVRFTDQNNVVHKRTFLLRVFGEKPTTFTLETRSAMLYETNSNVTH